MATEFDPRLIDEAVKFYKEIVLGGQPKNPNQFETDPRELALDIQATAFRANIPELIDRTNLRLEQATKDAISFYKGKNTAPPFKLTSLEDTLQNATVDSQKVKKLKSDLDVIRKQYRPIPEGASAIEAIKTGGKIVMESTVLAGLMKTGLTYQQAIASKAFQDFQSGFDLNMEKDMADFKKNPAAMQYLKDYPAFVDAISIGFSGPIGAARIPVREIMTHAMVLAEDPDVRKQAVKYLSSMGDDHSQESAFSDLVKAADKSLTKAYFSRDIKDRRLPYDLFLDFTMANPALWLSLIHI